MVFRTGVDTATRIMNAMMSAIATDDRIIMPDSFSSSLYCMTRTEIIEMDGAAVASAATRSGTGPNGKRNSAMPKIMSIGRMNELSERTSPVPDVLLRDVRVHLDSDEKDHEEERDRRDRLN